MLLSGLIIEVEEGLPVIEKKIVQMIARGRQGAERHPGPHGAEPRHAPKPLEATRA
jgi:hypothetical protein